MLAYLVCFQYCGPIVCTKALWSTDRWLNLLSKSEMFLTPLEEQNRVAIGNLMVTSLAALAAKAVEEKKCFFRLRPKFHLLHHAATDLRASNLNCNIHATWMDEDSIKRWMRVKRNVHKRTATESVLQRFLLGVRTNLERGLAKVKANKR